tara:strand:+ start:242 stop:418 length:177 start_codon:yes stop_codon:yes gene_type:complete
MIKQGKRQEKTLSDLIYKNAHTLRSILPIVIILSPISLTFFSSFSLILSKIKFYELKL